VCSSGFNVCRNLPLAILDSTGADRHAHCSPQARAHCLAGGGVSVGRGHRQVILDRLIAHWIRGANHLLCGGRAADAHRGLLLAIAARSGVAIMSRVTYGLLALLTYSSLVQAQALFPKDFAYGQLAIPDRDAAAYRFSLPLAVYQNTFRDDLGDLRVFNAEGMVVPFSLSRPAAQSSIHETPIALPMFPLHEGARILIDGVHLTINSAGSRSEE